MAAHSSSVTVTFPFGCFGTLIERTCFVSRCVAHSRATKSIRGSDAAPGKSDESAGTTLRIRTLVTNSVNCLCTPVKTSSAEPSGRLSPIRPAIALWCTLAAIRRAEGCSLIQLIGSSQSLRSDCLPGVAHLASTTTCAASPMNPSRHVRSKALGPNISESRYGVGRNSARINARAGTKNRIPCSDNSKT